VQYLREKRLLDRETFNLDVIRQNDEKSWLFIFWFWPEATIGEPRVYVKDDGSVTHHIGR